MWWNRLRTGVEGDGEPGVAADHGLAESPA
jgi:hypothetical protein